MSFITNRVKKIIRAGKRFSIGEAKSPKMCPYDEKGGDTGLNHSRYPAMRAVLADENLGAKHRKRVTCPLCKRRMWGWVRIGHDSDVIAIHVPPHKKKKWWKK